MKIYEQFGEHNLDDLILWLKERDGAELIKDNIEKLYHALYYFEAEQTESFYSKLNQSSAKSGASVSAAEFELFFTNLALLYPLSKHILLKIVHTHLLNKDDTLTGRFFDVYAIDEGLSAAYKETVLAVKDRLKGIPSRIRDIEAMIATHEKNIENARSTIKEETEKAQTKNTLYKEVQNLQAEVDTLKTKYSQDTLEVRRKELTREKANLENNKKQYEALSQQIADINKEIDRYSKDVCKENLAELSNKSKSLPENEEI